LDETGSIDAIAFSFVAEDLVERSVYLTSQNMRIDPLDHITALDKAIGKTKLFKIGMSGSESSSFAINYVLKKSFNVDASQISFTVPHAKVISITLILYTTTVFVTKPFLYLTKYYPCHLQTTTPMQIVEQREKNIKDASR
jgi:hypothetical protein